MSKYVITYYGYPKFDQPAQSAAYMSQWREWMGTLGEAMVNPGTPMKGGRTLSPEGVSDSARPEPLTGFSIVKADSLDEAVDLAKGCPHLKHGTIDVAEAMDMAMA